MHVCKYSKNLPFCPRFNTFSKPNKIYFEHNYFGSLFFFSLSLSPFFFLFLLRMHCDIIIHAYVMGSRSRRDSSRLLQFIFHCAILYYICKYCAGRYAWTFVASCIDIVRASLPRGRIWSSFSAWILYFFNGNSILTRLIMFILLLFNTRICVMCMKGNAITREAVRRYNIIL